MLSDKEFKSYAISSGKNINEVKKLYDKSIREARSLGKDKDKYFVLEMFEDMLGLEESSLIPKLVNKFVESDYTSFDDFLEMLSSEDIPQDVRPEMHVEEPFVNSEVDTTEDNEENIDDSEGLIERNLDGTGPEGKGPKTGRGLGNCDEEEIEEELLMFNKDKDVILDRDKIESDKDLLVDEECNDDKI